MNTSSAIRTLTSLATLVVLAIGLTAQAGWKAGSPLPDLTQFKLEGTVPADLKAKVVLIDFWASWCGPCKASFPVLDSLQKDYGPRGLVIIAINQDQTSALMKSFLETHPATFLTVRDAGNLLVAAADVQSMPSSYLFDRAGKLRFLHTGFHGEKTTTQYREEIERLLNEKDGLKK
jgi:thiol-disulfide isomerase/thioredoxin